MSFIDDVAKIIGSFKPIDIKTEIKNPTIAPVLSYQSPTNNTFNFQSVEINNTQLNTMADKITDTLIEGIKMRMVGSIASDTKLQNEISRLSSDQLPNFFKTAMMGTATLSEVQPDFVTAGTTVFPKPESLFQAGYEIGTQGKRINNVRIMNNADGSITIQYEEN